MQHWQSITAIAIVVITLAVFIVRIVKNIGAHKSSGCGHDCGCDKKQRHPDQD